MSYTPTEWKNGDTITAEKLNHIESGIENILPPATVENIGKTLMVVPDWEHVTSREVVSEQTITIVDGPVEIDADWGIFTPAATLEAKMSFNGEQYDAYTASNPSIVTPYYEIPALVDELLIYVRITLNTETRVTLAEVMTDRGGPIPGEYSISLTMFIPEAKYGFDIFIPEEPPAEPSDEISENA